MLKDMKLVKNVGSTSAQQFLCFQNVGLCCSRLSNSLFGKQTHARAQRSQVLVPGSFAVIFKRKQLAAC